MKTLLLMLCIAFASLCLNAQDIKPTDKVLKDTTINKVDYKLYIGSRGGKYVLRTSKTGKVYKMYVPRKK